VPSFIDTKECSRRVYALLVFGCDARLCVRAYPKNINKIAQTKQSHSTYNKLA
jgi:hypothetical protein